MEERVARIRERIVYYWPTYGPPVLGAVLVLLAFFVGYRILSSRSQNEANKPQVNESNLTLNVQSPTPVEPNSTVTLPAGVTPTPTTSATDSVSMTKGGVAASPSAGDKLPETGFPLVFVLPGLLGVSAGGYKLSKFKKG